MGHHCGCFVCDECKTLSSSHLDGILDTGYVQLCPDCAKYEIMKQEDESSEPEENIETIESEEDNEEIEKPPNETDQISKKRKLSDKLTTKLEQ